MKAFSSLGLGLTLVSSFLFLALMAELYYLFLWKKRRTGRDIEASYSSASAELLHLFCWKKPSSLSSTALNPQQIHHNSLNGGADEAPDQDDHSPRKLFAEGEDSVEAELMRLHSLSGPPRLLFTITEETKEDMESEDGIRSRGGRSRRGSRGKSLGDLLYCAESPLILSPLPSPPLLSLPMAAPVDSYKQLGFNPLFESTSSPPPKFKFLKDAEEKLYRKALREEAMRARINGGPAEEVTKPAMSPEEGGGAYITLVIAKNKDRGQQQNHHHHLSSSQVTPLPSSPSSIRNGQGKPHSLAPL